MQTLTSIVIFSPPKLAEGESIEFVVQLLEQMNSSNHAEDEKSVQPYFTVVFRTGWFGSLSQEFELSAAMEADVIEISRTIIFSLPLFHWLIFLYPAVIG